MDMESDGFLTVVAVIYWVRAHAYLCGIGWVYIRALFRTWMVVIPYLRSALLTYAAMRTIKALFKSFVYVPSVIEMIFVLVFVTLNGPLHWHKNSPKT